MVPQIPKILHQLWIGPRPKPEAWMQSWRTMYADWDYREWNESNLAEIPFQNQALIDRIPEWNGKADVMRYELLCRFGGVFLDADSLAVERMPDDFLANDFFACYEQETERPALIACGVLGATPGNHLMALACQELGGLTTPTGPAWKTVGPLFLSRLIYKHRYPATIYPSHFFFPDHYTGNAYAGPGPVYARHFWESTPRRPVTVDSEIHEPVMTPR